MTEKKLTNLTTAGNYIVASGGWSVPAAHAYPVSPPITPTAFPPTGRLIGHFGAQHITSGSQYEMAAYWINLCAANPHWKIGVFTVDRIAEPLLLPVSNNSVRKAQFDHNPVGELIAIRPDAHREEFYQLTFANRATVTFKQLEHIYALHAEQSVRYDAVLYLGIDRRDADYRLAIGKLEDGQALFNVTPRIRNYI